jgi:hypothetical protein
VYAKWLKGGEGESLKSEKPPTPELTPPDRPIAEVRKFVEAGDLTGLVRTIGGVDPAALSVVAGSPDNEAVHEAFVIREIELAMKDTRKVWLSGEDLLALSGVESLSEAATRLAEAGLIRIRGDEGEAALSWAADQLDAFLKAYPEYEIQHAPGVDLKSTDSLAQKDKRTAGGAAIFKVDVTRAVDRFIDKGSIPITMVPGAPTAGINWTRPGRMTPQRLAQLCYAVGAKFVDGRKKGLAALAPVRDRVFMKRVLVAAEENLDVILEAPGTYTCVATRPIPPIAIGGDIVLIQEIVTVHDRYRILAAGEVTAERGAVHQGTRRVRNVYPKDLPGIRTGAFDACVLIMNGVGHERWVYEAKRVATQLTFILLVN